MADENPLAGLLNFDPDMPPGTVELRSGDQRLRTLLPSATEEALRQRFLNGDPKLVEEFRSLAESQDYFTYSGEATDPIPCECCGTLVTMVPETTRLRDHPKPAIWEPGPWRKHTMRRCNAMRGVRDH
jgi:hypothetical protein